MNPINRNYLNADKTAWTDGDGVLHIDAVRMCEVMGVEPTPVNQNTIEAEAIKVFSKANPSVPVKTICDLL